MYFTTSYGSVKGLMTGAVFSIIRLRISSYRTFANIVSTDNRFFGGQVATHVVPDV